MKSDVTSQNIKILLMSNMYPSLSHPTYGVFVKNFEEGILANEGTVLKVVIKGRGRSHVEKLHKYMNYIYEVYKFIFFSNYDLLYVHYIGHSLLPLVLIQKFIKKPLVINAHGSDVFTASKTKEMIQKIVTPIIKKADLIVVPSSYFKCALSNRFLISSDKIFTSPSGGIDTSRFKPLYVPIANSYFTIGYVSRIDEGKGWDTLIFSIAELKKNTTDKFKVVIIGSGSQKKDLNNMLIEFSLQDEVTYLGPVPHKELVHYYNSFDIFVFPTRLTESLGLVGLEAMACGVPVIGSNIGGLKGYIKNGYNGFLFEPGDYSKLTTCIKKYMSLTQNEKESFIKNAVITASCYDSDRVSKELFKKLCDIIANKTTQVKQSVI